MYIPGNESERDRFFLDTCNFCSQHLATSVAIAYVQMPKATHTRKLASEYGIVTGKDMLYHSGTIVMRCEAGTK